MRGSDSLTTNPLAMVSVPRIYGGWELILEKSPSDLRLDQHPEAAVSMVAHLTTRHVGPDAAVAHAGFDDTVQDPMS